MPDTPSLLPTTWDLTPLATSDSDLALVEDQAATAAAVDRFVCEWEPRRDYLESAAALRQALDAYELLEREHSTQGKFGYYAALRGDQEAANPGVKAMLNRSQEEAIQLTNRLQFFELRLAKATKEAQAHFLTDTQLAPYRHFLVRLFAQANHQLSESEERILNLKSPGARQNWVQMLNGLLAKQTHTVIDESNQSSARTLPEISALLSSRSKPVRDAAAGAIHTITAELADVAEAEFNAVLADRKVEDSLRGFIRPDAARHLNDDIDSTVVDALVAAVSNHFEIPARFYALKAKLLGQATLGYHERTVPYGEQRKAYSYEEAVQLVERVLGRVESQFATIFRQFAEMGQLDVYPRPGKAGGAHCRAGLYNQPVYILLNHTNKLQDVLTLAHETGHGINDELIRANQHALYFSTPLSTAEVASTFMEDFVLGDILRTADDEERLSIMVSKLDDSTSTIFRQIAAYRFEQEIHQLFRQSGYLSREQIGETFKAHMHSYTGDAVRKDPGMENWWVQWSHFRRPFYVYSYASGLLIAKALQAKVQREPAFIKEVVRFLSAGTSASPREIFAELGIDITDARFWETGLETTQKLLEETEALAKKLGKV